MIIDAHTHLYSQDAPDILERYVTQHGVSGLRIQSAIFNLARFNDPATTPLWRWGA